MHLLDLLGEGCGLLLRALIGIDGRVELRLVGSLWLLGFGSSLLRSSHVGLLSDYGVKSVMRWNMPDAEEPARVVAEAVKELTKVPVVPIEVSSPLGSEVPEPERM